MKHFRILTIAIALTASLSLTATTYYCSPTGNGNGRSYSTPCSLSTGLGKLQAGGDTLYLLGGDYMQSASTSFNKSGSAQANIVISGYPGEKATIDYRAVTYGTRGFCVGTCSYVHIKDLSIANSGKNNLYNAGSYCTFENLDIYGSADTGCQMKGGGNNLIKNVDSHDNFDYEHYNSQGAADFGGNADGFADKQFTGDGNHYVGCRSWNNSDDGWDFFQRVSSSETIIEHCICYKNGPAEYNMYESARYQTDKDWLDAINGTTITNRYGQEQVIDLAHYPCHGNGNGFKMGGYYTNHLILIHHCLSVANTVNGFDQNNNDGTMRVYNNTAYLNGGHNFGFTTAYGTLSIQNNASLSGTNAPQSSTTLVNSHNTWNGGVNCTAADFESLDTTEILRPRLADGSLRIFDNSASNGNTLLHLVAGSDLIDAGAILELDYMGQAPDLGCFETDGLVRPSIVLTSGPAEQWVVSGNAITPIVVTWNGAETAPSGSLPNGIVATVDNNKKTVTLSGAINLPGDYTFTLTTTADSLNRSIDITIHVKKAGLRKVAFVTTPGSAADQLMVDHLSQSDSLEVSITDAANSATDYSGYQLIIIGPTPKSSTAGFAALKGYDCPMLVLKPFLFKSGVWDWATPQNTADLAINISDSSHPIFSTLPIADGTLQLFSACTTNAVTSVSDWTNTTGAIALASPASHSNYTAIAELPANTVCNGTELKKTMLMLGVSEYSTASLTADGLALIENAVYYLLGLPIPQHSTGIENVGNKAQAEKIIRGSQIIIVRDGIEYNILGCRL